MAYFTNMSTELPFTGAARAHFLSAVADYERRAGEAEESDDYDLADELSPLHCDIVEEDDVLLLTDNEGLINIDRLVELTQATLKAFDLPPIGFQWSFGCKKLLDASGGAAVFITRDNIESASTFEWLAARGVE